MSSLYSAQKELQDLNADINTLNGLMTGTEKPKYSTTFAEMQKKIKRTIRLIEIFCDDQDIEDDGFELQSDLPKLTNQLDKMIFDDLMECFDLMKTKKLTTITESIKELKNNLSK